VRRVPVPPRVQRLRLMRVGENVRGPLRRHVRPLLLLMLMLILMLMLMVLLLMRVMLLRARVFVALGRVLLSFPSRRPIVFAL
jgi:hypothetical protein